MVVGQILSRKRLLELAGNPREKDRYLMEQLRIDKIGLGYVRGIFSQLVKVKVLGIPLFKTQASFEVDSLYRAAEILGERDPKFITAMNLAVLIFTAWDEPTTQAKRVHQQLKKRYREERKGFLVEFGIKLPYTEFLKEEVTGRELNCLKAKEKYKNFRVSTEDILRNVALPDLDYQTGVLLGVYRGRGSIRQNRQVSCIVQLTGNSKNEFDFYEFYVKRVIKELHNLEVEIRPVKRKRIINGENTKPSIPKSNLDQR